MLLYLEVHFMSLEVIIFNPFSLPFVPPHPGWPTHPLVRVVFFAAHVPSKTPPPKKKNCWCKKTTTTDAAVVVQTFVRGAQARRNYAVLVVEHREAAKLENQILALQRKLEEERKARLEMEAVRFVPRSVVVSYFRVEKMNTHKTKRNTTAPAQRFNSSC